MITFDSLRAANTARLPQFKNAKGEPAHTRADGSDWSLNDWMTAVAGEVGEAANLLKKIRRGDVSLAETKEKLEAEFADIVTYLDILAMQCDIDLGDAVRRKFNTISARIGVNVTMMTDGRVISGEHTFFDPFI